MSVDNNQEPRCVISDLMDENKALRIQIAQQADMVEKCMVAMNANADEVDRLKGRLAALAEPSEAVWLPSTEWTPCMKLPVVVHVRKQREGESHVSTREGITPVKPDDLIMRGVSGEEYPIGREIFEKTYRIGDTHPAPSKPEPDKDLIQALTERDEYHEMADKLAEGIALHFDGDIGEHSSSNSPWDRALDLLDSAACAETMRLSGKPEPSEAVGKILDEAEMQTTTLRDNVIWWNKPASGFIYAHPAPSKLTLDGNTTAEFALAELYKFQEATGCDTADQMKPQAMFKMVEEGDAWNAPFMTIGKDEAQSLIDELWHLGFRPERGQMSVGQVAATEKHLEDMRQLVFSQLKVAKP